jgi:1-phosphofructokinase family hexose kinase
MILAAGLTSAWQRLLSFGPVTLGAVNRAREVQECAAGKAVNMAVDLHSLGAPVRLLTLAGGERGKAFLRHLGSVGVEVRGVPAAAETRVCTTLLEEGRATELVENMGAVSPAELGAFAAAFAEEAAGAGVAALSGSLPEGAPATFYRDLAAKARGSVVLDARGPELLEALAARPFLVKPNRRELGETLGRELPDDRALEAAMAEILERGARWIVVTDGVGPVRVRGEGRAAAFRPPAVRAVNPIGCGDCLAAGVAFGLSQGRDPVEAVRLGIAAAADKLGQVLPAGVDPGRVARLADRVEPA